MDERGVRLWAEQSALECANPATLDLIRNRNGTIIRAKLRVHIDAVAASSIGTHNKGKAYLQPIGPTHARIGWAWALSGVEA